jgi:hypothetical protein
MIGETAASVDWPEAATASGAFAEARVSTSCGWE